MGEASKKSALIEELCADLQGTIDYAQANPDRVSVVYAMLRDAMVRMQKTSQKLRARSLPNVIEK